MGICLSFGWCVYEYLLEEITALKSYTLSCLRLRHQPSSHGFWQRRAPFAADGQGTSSGQRFSEEPLEDAASGYTIAADARGSTDVPSVTGTDGAYVPDGWHECASTARWGASVSFRQ